jgi:hypothetical protein
MPEGWHQLALEIQNNTHDPWQSLIRIVVMSVVKVMNGFEREVNDNSEM